MADDRKLSITYSSGLIPPPEHMSTLAVFYDEIWLPCPCEYMLPTRTLTISFSSLVTEESEKIYKSKVDIFKPLFDEKIIKLLPESNKNFSKQEYQGNPDFIEAFNALLVRFYHLSQYERAERVSLAAHALYGTKPAPELFISDSSDTSTSRLAGFLVDAIFQLKIPQLKTLNAEQILEVRYKLRDFKEGFTDYVIRLTNDVEALLQSGETSELVAAQKIAERHFETEYNQIRRQIEPLKIMSLGSVLAASGAFFLAGAVQTTPALLAALAVLYGTVLKDFWQQEGANQTADKQAFKYIATLESEVSKRSR